MAGRSSFDRIVEKTVDDIVSQSSQMIAVDLQKSPVNSPIDEVLPASAIETDTSAEGDSAEGDEAALLTLQNLLFRSDRERIADLDRRVQSVQNQLSNEEALAAAVAPALADAIRMQIAESQEEIIDALYPIIGRLVMKAVTEAMRDLARSIDEKLQQLTNYQSVWVRLRAYVSGVSVGELVMRESLASIIEEIYLIHRETGLLLWHASRVADESKSSDSDLIGAMLTAIRDFAQHVLGGGQEQQLNELQYGERLIVLEFARHSYVGVVVRGVPPVQFRAELCHRIADFDLAARELIREYRGEALPVKGMADEIFGPMILEGGQ